jgi:hypothetical protein
MLEAWEFVASAFEGIGKPPEEYPGTHTRQENQDHWYQFHLSL